MDDSNASSQQVARILYKEILPGDLRKILAQSNDSDTGGGARDFRFGSYNQVVPVIKEMFPDTIQEERKRDGVTTYIDIFKGRFYWERADGSVDSRVSYFEPPTDVRPAEGRIVRVHEYGCFDTNLIPKGGHGNRVLLLLIQRKDGKVWPHFAEEQSLRQAGVWDPIVAKELLGCLDATRPSNRATIGYRDFTSTGRYCNGK
ncbi:MAG: hypothetical protein ACO1PB_04765 [Ramlibacter sp.]